MVGQDLCIVGQDLCLVGQDMCMVGQNQNLVAHDGIYVFETCRSKSMSNKSKFNKSFKNFFHLI